MQQFSLPERWYERDYEDEYRMSPREVELEEEFADLTDSFKRMVSLMSDQQYVHSRDFNYAISDIAEKLNFNIERFGNLKFGITDDK